MPAAGPPPGIPDRAPDRTAAVPIARLAGWSARFTQRHGALQLATTDTGWVLAGATAVALIAVPGWLVPGADLPEPQALPEIANELGYAVLVVRRAGYLVALVRRGELVGSKVGSRHIHGRTAAGGWSQKRYARRRANQGDEIAGAAASALAALGSTADLDFLVLAGDRELREQAHELLPAGLRALRLGPALAIGTPTRADLVGLPAKVTALSVAVWDC